VASTKTKPQAKDNGAKKPTAKKSPKAKSKGKTTATAK